MHGSFILHTLEGAPERAVLYGFLTDRYANVEDYTRGVREVWGDAPADRMNSALTRAINEQPSVVAFGDTQRAEERAANAVLVHMPEPDFRAAVSEAVRQQRLAASPVDRITSIGQAPNPVGVHGERGIPLDRRRGDGGSRDAPSAECDRRPAAPRRQEPLEHGPLRAGTRHANVAAPVGRRIGNAAEGTTKVLLTHAA